MMHAPQERGTAAMAVVDDAQQPPASLPPALRRAALTRQEERGRTPSSPAAASAGGADDALRRHEQLLLSFTRWPDHAIVYAAPLHTAERTAAACLARMLRRTPRRLLRPLAAHGRVMEHVGRAAVATAASARGVVMVVEQRESGSGEGGSETWRAVLSEGDELLLDSLLDEDDDDGGDGGDDGSDEEDDDEEERPSARGLLEAARAQARGHLLELNAVAFEDAAAVAAAAADDEAPSDEARQRRKQEVRRLLGVDGAQLSEDQVRSVYRPLSKELLKLQPHQS